jgi:hypothetical protein
MTITQTHHSPPIIGIPQTPSKEDSVTDDPFVQRLHSLAAAAPTIAVDTSRVVPTGLRRRRERRRSIATFSFGLAVLAGVGFTQAPAWSGASGPVTAQVAVETQPVGQHAAPAPEPLGVTPLEPATARGIDPAGSGAEPTKDSSVTAISAATHAGLPVAAVVALGAVGLGAVGTSAWFAARSRRITAA